MSWGAQRHWDRSARGLRMLETPGHPGLGVWGLGGPSRVTGSEWRVRWLGAGWLPTRTRGATAGRGRGPALRTRFLSAGLNEGKTCPRNYYLRPHLPSLRCISALGRPTIPLTGDAGLPPAFSPDQTGDLALTSPRATLSPTEVGQRLDWCTTTRPVHHVGANLWT